MQKVGFLSLKIKIMKKQSAIITFIVIALVLLGILLAASRNKIAEENGGANVATPLNTTSVLSLAESSYDFGSVSMAKGVVTHDFVITNDSGEVVDIGEVWTSCMCTEAFLEVGNNEVGPFGMPGHGSVKKANTQIQPGEKFALRAQFDPAAHGPAGVGPIKRDVYLMVGENEKVTVSFTATVTP